MKYYFDRTDSEGAKTIYGGFEQQQDAELTRNALGEDFPADEITPIYQEDDNYIERTVPVVQMIYATGDGDMLLYTDGTTEPAS